MIINDDKKSDYLSKEELTMMADIVSDAVVNHSNFRYTFRNEKKRKKALFNAFLLMYKVINIYGYTYIVKEQNEIIGYITYMDSSDKEQISFGRILKTKGLLQGIKFALLLNIFEMIRLRKYIKTYNNYEKTEDKEYKIHLYSTGVKSEYKGKGIMGKAIRNTYQYFSDLGYKEMVLETADPINIPIYNKLGFNIIESRSTKDNLQTITFMVKPL